MVHSLFFLSFVFSLFPFIPGLSIYWLGLVGVNFPTHMLYKVTHLTLFGGILLGIYLFYIISLCLFLLHLLIV